MLEIAVDSVIWRREVPQIFEHTYGVGLPVTTVSGFFPIHREDTIPWIACAALAQ